MTTTKTWGALGLLLALAGAHEARAEDCGNIAETGICQDPKTLLYCARGELKTMTCGADEICVAHELFEGSSGCVATRYTGCGDITEAGRCVGDRLVLYCENNHVAERVCGDGLVCGLVDGAASGSDAYGDYYDCVSELGPSFVDGDADSGGVPPVESEVEDDDDVAELEPTSPETSLTGPSVERGGAPAAGTTAGGDGACAGGGAAGLLGLALAAASLAATLTASRRRTARSR